MNKPKKPNNQKTKRGIEQNEKSQTSIMLYVFVFLILILLSLMLILVYLLYINTPEEPEELNVIIEKPFNLKNQTLEVKQFYSNMKFNHKRISYKIGAECSEEKKLRILEAFKELSDKVDVISFYEDTGDVDIEISCSEEKQSIEEDFFIAGEGGAKEVIKTEQYNVIKNGIIFLYNNHQSKGLECNYPNVELHELMHVFGFDHSDNKNSLMYPYLESCNQELDDSIIKELKRLYTEENLPDLYFKDVKAVLKKEVFRSYLDFNLTIKNSGTIKAVNTSFSILDNGELVKTQKLEDLNYGGGILIEINNLKLIHKNPTRIRFILDIDNLIKEIDEENNIAIVEFED